MRFAASDFRLIRWNMLAMCASILAGALLLHAGIRHAERMRAEHGDAQQRLDQARSKLIGAQEDRQNMAAYADEYAALAASGIVGEDRRLDWVEGLENIRRQDLVTDFRYTIAPQTSYAPQPAIGDGAFDIRHSEMKLQFGLLHEGQLPAFFAALRSQVKGRYLLKGCAMQRTGPHDNPDIRITAGCTGGWITLKRRNGASQ